MKISKKGIDLIKYFEGVKNRPYLCPASLWTIGVGSVLYPEQAKLKVEDRKSFPLKSADNRVWSDNEIDTLFLTDVYRFERGVERYITVPLTQGQFDCLVAFSFNLGLGTLQKSTLRQKLNRQDYEGAVESLLKYNKAAGKILKGLDLRRKAEAALFMSK